MIYAWLKLIHLLAIVIWIGPPLGAYAVLMAAYRGRDKDRIIWVERITEKVLVVEHIAFVVLIATGLAIVYVGPWQLFETPWLRTKLMLFAGVLAFEFVDIWLAHVVMPKLLRNDAPFSDPRFKRALRLRGRMSALSVVVICVLIPGMFYFAIVKS